MVGDSGLLEDDGVSVRVVHDGLGAPRLAGRGALEFDACLKWCGLATSERRGREVVYRITDPRVRQLLDLSRALDKERSEHLASCTRIGPDWI